ncbi:MAG: hypothetical protein O3B84_00695, partial [Chloroflexi bacterium]|nr:hypothetical protein [Chloroflexota bacterium]
KEQEMEASLALATSGPPDDDPSSAGQPHSAAVALDQETRQAFVGRTLELRELERSRPGRGIV